jgi:hypothetical protein
MFLGILRLFFLCGFLSQTVVFQLDGKCWFAELMNVGLVVVVCHVVEFVDRAFDLCQCFGESVGNNIIFYFFIKFNVKDVCLLNILPHYLRCRIHSNLIIDYPFS